MTTTSAPSTFLNASQDLAREAHRTRARIYGAVTLLIAVAMYVFFANGVDPALQSSFGLNQGAVPKEQRMPDWVVPSFATVATLEEQYYYYGYEAQVIGDTLVLPQGPYGVELVDLTP